MGKSQPESFSFIRFLNAKKSVDDRSLNQHVWGSLATAVKTLQEKNGELKILEIGSGTGTMLQRILETRLIEKGDYTGLDISNEHLSEARNKIFTFASNNGYEVLDSGNSHILNKESHQVRVTFKRYDLYEFLEEGQGQHSFDLLIAHAFLDLINLSRTLPHLFTLLRVGGIFYFSGNYDGAIIFEPKLDPEMDDYIENHYQRSMDERITYGRITGDRLAGRHLFCLLRKVGAVLIDAGSSDWIVFSSDKGYRSDEAYFLHYVINSVEKTLSSSPDLDKEKFLNWIQERHSQVRCGELALIAHQLDFVGYWS
jgi:SAM-dependent methyltransferase